MKKQPGLSNVSVQLADKLVARVRAVTQTTMAEFIRRAVEDLVEFHERGKTSEEYLKKYRLRPQNTGKLLEQNTGKTSRHGAR